MDNMPSAVSMTLSLDNSLCNSSGITTQVEIARLKLVTDSVGLLADPVQGVADGSISLGGICITKSVKDDVGEGSNLLKIQDSSENGLIDVVIRESEEDEVFSVVEDTSALIAKKLLVLETTSGVALSKSVEIEDSQIIAKAIIVESTNEVQVPTAKLLNAAVSPNAEISDGPDLKASVVLKLPSEKGLGKGPIKSVFELDCVPLWGYVSICGRRPEMEDSVAAVPHFARIPIKMLVGDRMLDGLSQSLTHVTGHFFGVYDGHGGAQVANYCRERVNVVLAEEIANIRDELSNGLVGNQQVQWEKAFTSCFLKVDNEVGGNCTSPIMETEDSSSISSAPIAPETVGSTAVVAMVCSSHIIVANCGDSRAVLCRGKEAIALSVDHKPSRDDEYARIEASGGKVIQWNGHRVFGVLAMSRAIGDRYLKPWIIPEPEVTFTPRARDDECLILASDGLWDILTNEEACEIARRRLMHWHKKNGVASPVDRGNVIDPAAQDAADYLSNLAFQKGSNDNISVIVVDLKAQRKYKTKS